MICGLPIRLLQSRYICCRVHFPHWYFWKCPEFFYQDGWCFFELNNMYTLLPPATRPNSVSLSAVCLSLVLIALPPMSAAEPDVADTNVLGLTSDASRFVATAEAFRFASVADATRLDLTSDATLFASAPDATRFTSTPKASGNQPARSSRRPRGAHEAESYYSFGLNIGGGDLGSASGFQLNIDSTYIYGQGFGLDVNIGIFDSSKLNSPFLIFAFGLIYNYALDDPHHNIYATLGLARVDFDASNTDGTTSESSALGYYFGIGYSYVLESGVYFYVDLSPVSDTHDTLFIYGVGVGFRVF